MSPKATQIDALIGAIEKAFGAVGILVNNAGITQDNLMLRMKDAEWDAVIDTNLKSVFRLSRAVLRGMMKARAGRIINITSVVGASGNPGQVNYAAAKAGIAGMARVARARNRQPQHHRQLRRAGLHRHRHDARAARTGSARALLAQIPLGRLGQPEDIAAAVLFLASPAAPTSPARRCTSTAACTWTDADSRALQPAVRPKRAVSF